jgi:hypothetical protein
MHKILYYAFALVALTSCSKSQFVSVRSNAKEAGNGNYFFENDSVKITYNFKGENGPVKISVFNKLSHPLYLDWTKSAVIVNQQSLPMWKDESRVSTVTNATEIDWGYVTTTSGSTDGSITRPAAVAFIPPQSEISDSRVLLKRSLFAESEKSKSKKSRKRIFLSTGPATANLYEFKREDSPLTFRTYLTLSMDQNISSSVHIENEFWVGEILQSGDFKNTYRPRNNEFSLTKATKLTSVVATTAVLGGAVLFAAIKAEE